MEKNTHRPLANPTGINKLPGATKTGDIMAFPFRASNKWARKSAVIPDYTNQLDLFSGGL